MKKVLLAMLFLLLPLTALPVVRNGLYSRMSCTQGGIPRPSFVERTAASAVMQLGLRPQWALEIERREIIATVGPRLSIPLHRGCVERR